MSLKNKIAKNERQQERQQERKSKILAAAETIFMEKGFHAASMHDVAKAAGVSTAHLYNFYENKAALALAVQNKMSQESFERLTAAMQSDGSSIQAENSCLFDPRSAALTLTVLTEASRNPEIRRKVIENGELLKSQLKEYYKIADDDVERNLRLKLSMSLFLGLAIRSIFEESLELEVLQKLLVSTNRWLMNEEKEKKLS